MIGRRFLADQFQAPYYLKLREFLKQEYSTQRIHPDMYHIFEALELTPYSKVRSCNLRTRSLSWRKSSARLILFRTAGSQSTAFITKYLSRIAKMI